MAPGADQFNGLHEGLVERWEELKRAEGRDRLHLACRTPDPAREGELVYRAAAAGEAGIAATLLPLGAIGWDGQRLLDAEGESISWLAPLHPWEELARDGFLGPLRAAAGSRGAGLAVIEPAWRWIASNHGALALLWRFNPGHPNLCAAGLEPRGAADAESVTVRAFFGRGRAPERRIEGGAVASDTGLDDRAPAVWLETPPVFEQDGAHAVIDAWIIGDKCLGMSVRESPDPRLIGPDAAVLPHVIV